MATLFRPKEEKLFSDKAIATEYILGQSKSICKELIKALTMFTEESNNLLEQIPHWIEKPNGYLWDVLTIANRNNILVNLVFYPIYLHKDIIVFGNRTVKPEKDCRNKYKDPVTFIRLIENEILTENGGKYKDALKSLSDFKKDKFYMDFFLYLGLCLNVPDLFKREEPYKVLSDFWKGTIKPRDKNIELTDKNQLKYIIAYCMKNYMEPEYNEFLEALLEELRPSVKSKLRL